MIRAHTYSNDNSDQPYARIRCKNVWKWNDAETSRFSCPVISEWIYVRPFPHVVAKATKRLK